MNNNIEKNIDELVKQYINAELDAEEVCEYLIQINSMDSKTYDYKTYKKNKGKHFVVARNMFSRLVNKTTVGFASGTIGLMLMMVVNRFLNGNVRDVVMATQTIKIMMIYEAILIILTFLLCAYHEAKVLSRMGIRIFSLDLFRLDPEDELSEEEDK